MRQTNHPLSRRLLILAGLLLPTAASAQSAPDVPPPDWTSGYDVTAAPQDNKPKPRRIQMFRISDPVGLDTDDATPDTAAPADDGPDWLQVSMGNDNPFFDFRRPGDPGGVGFYKLHSQVQVLDNGKTAVSVGVQAVAPAGLEQDGVQNGQTVVSPSLCLYHQLDDGTGFQGFLSKNMNLNTSSLTQPMQYNVQYGLAVQRPLVDTGPDKLGSFYVFVEALGRYHYDDVTATGPPTVWEMVPGLHSRMTDNLWLSGGVLVPVNNTAQASRDAHLWQVTCSFQF